MKNIDIRDKFNKKITLHIKNEINKIDSLEMFEYKDKNNKQKIIREEFYKLKFIFDFQEEDIGFLKNIEEAIKNFDLDLLINLCDSYEYRFFKIFDYINDNNIIIEADYNKIYSLFINLFKNGITINSINLSIFVLSFFNNIEIFNFCKYVLRDNIDYIEICGFILKDDYIDGSCTYLDIFKCVYRDNEDFIEVLDKLNISHFNSYNKLILCFYLFNILDFKFQDLSIDRFKVFFRYIYNYKKSLKNISSKFLFEDGLSKFKILFNDINLILNKIETIKYKFSNYDKLDVEIDLMNVKLFDKFKESYLTDKFLDILFKKFIEEFENRNFNNLRQIIMLYNELDINICEKLQSIFFTEYNSIQFCKFILRVFRNYKYFDCILSKVEDNFYLTELIGDDDFRIILLRSLCVLYSNLHNKVVGIKFLKLIMNSQECYEKYSLYINFITEKVLERSGD